MVWILQNDSSKTARAMTAAIVVTLAAAFHTAGAGESKTLTPEQVKEVYHIPVEIAPGPFTA
jgi:uncharacterized protein involved in high-affinity Fe2+ transport